jgi:glutamate:GABA antiporter
LSTTTQPAQPAPPDPRPRTPRSRPPLRRRRLQPQRRPLHRRQRRRHHLALDHLALLFFWPQGIAVIELAHRYPGEGGVYLWAKEVFGDFHGFLSGWCYWTNNMLYVPTVMLYFVGVSVFASVPATRLLPITNSSRSPHLSRLLALLTVLNIVGLGVGKWINNLGAIGTFIAAAVLIGLGIVIWSRFGTTVTAADFKIPANPRFVLNSFGVICFGLVGLELASVMGDEIQDPRRTLPGAVAWGGVISGALYVGATRSRC